MLAVLSRGDAVNDVATYGRPDPAVEVEPEVDVTFAAIPTADPSVEVEVVDIDPGV